MTGKNLAKAKITELYSTSSIAIVSSLYEGFGYPVIEAMSCEVPLIATNISSIPELVDDYATLVDPKSHKMISDSDSTNLYLFTSSLFLNVCR